MSERPHGYARYKLDGCRCNACGWAAAQYRDAREHAIRRGTWQPWADAQPVREHIANLRACGMGLRAIADAAGVDRQRLGAVVNGRPYRGAGPQSKVRPALAAAILAVEPTLDTLAASTPVGATGTRRRLHALIAAGWPQQHLARQLGMTPSNFGGTLSRDQVLARTARAVRDLYGRLWNESPLDHGATVRGVTRARRHAQGSGWAPGAAWDDDLIDDPDAFPDWTGQCGTPKGYHAHYRHRILPVCDPCRAAHAEARKAVAA